MDDDEVGIKGSAREGSPFEWIALRSDFVAEGGVIDEDSCGAQGWEVLGFREREVEARGALANFLSEVGVCDHFESVVGVGVFPVGFRSVDRRGVFPTFQG